MNLTHYIEQLAYAGILLWFMVMEQFTPVPEEVSLMTLGYLCMHTTLRLLPAGVTALGGLLIMDNVLYYLSRSGNKLVGKLLHRAGGSRLQAIQDKLQKKPAITLFVAALLPKLRFFSPMVAASIQVSWRLFFVVDLVATSLYVSVYMLCGALFYGQLANLFHRQQLWQHAVFVLCMILVLLIIIYLLKKRRL